MLIFSNGTAYCNKMSCFIYIEFITNELLTKNTNITTNFNWKLFRKVIRAKQRKLGFAQTECLMQRSASAKNLVKID